ncbi:glycoside hydrolase family 2 TIM barrel-domain containing protein [Spirosoma luteolum]
MMHRYFTWLFLLLLLQTTGCQDAKTSRRVPANAPVTIEQGPAGAVLLRHGKPYFIRGAGGRRNMERAAQCGSNSIRIWDDLDAGPILDQADRLGLTVMLGLWVERETDGFDYNDQAAVDRQMARIRRTVLRYRNHPALLMWCVGNEWAQDATNFAVFDEVNRIVQVVHELDPGHPVTTAISPDSGRSIWLVQERCPDLDILSVNAYGIMPKLNQFLHEGGWRKPYLMSEYGAEGYWERPLTPWKTPIEPTSQGKVEFVRRLYGQFIGARLPNCLGGYLFFWGVKQEETHTWYSLFDEEGRETPLVGLAQTLWTGKGPANQAPIVTAIAVDGQPRSQASFAVTDRLHQARVLARDPDGDTLTYRWEIKPTAQRTADYIDTALQPLGGLIDAPGSAAVRFRMPARPGFYRLFVAVYDQHNHVGTANVAFRVTPAPVAGRP